MPAKAVQIPAGSPDSGFHAGHPTPYGEYTSIIFRTSPPAMPRINRNNPGPGYGRLPVTQTTASL